MKNTKISFYDSPPSSPVSPFAHKTTEEMMAMDDAEFFDCLEQELESDFYSSSSSTSEEISASPDDDSRTLGQFLDLDLGSNESQQKISTSVSSIPSYQVIPEPEISFPLENFSKFPDFDGTSGYLQTFRFPPVEERIPIRNEDVYEYPPKSPIFINLVPEPAYTIYRVVDRDIPKNSDEEVRYVGNSFDPDRRLDVCRAFARQLNSSDFPFSVEQREVSSRIDNQIGILHLLPNQKEDGIFTQYREQELKLISEIDLLMDLFASTDYQPVSQTLINRYVAAMIYELEFWISKDPAISLNISGKIPFFVDPANYMIDKLLEIFPGADDNMIEAAFFTERQNIHVELTSLFAQSKFPFTVSQRSLIMDVAKAVHTTNGDPDSKEEREFQKTLGKLLHDLNNIDNGVRVGISNPKKVRKEFNRFIDNLLDLRKKERKFLSEFERFSLNPADLVDSVFKILICDFIPRYTLREPSPPNALMHLNN